MYLGILMKFDVNLPLLWDMYAYVQRIEGAIIVPSKMQKHTLTCKRTNSSGTGMGIVLIMTCFLPSFNISKFCWRSI